MVELAGVADPTRLNTVVARALGVEGQRGVRLEDRLAARLQERSLLLLDNCEHLIEASATLTRFLLLRCPGLRVIATSREPLEIEGERIVGVQPLTIAERPDELAARDVAHFPGLELFVDRATARNPAFRVTSENVGTIGRICEAMGGIPLALELAASQLGHITLEDLESQLGSQLTFENPRRDACPHHRTMRDALDWTWEGISPHEQELWERFWVFADGAGTEAIDEIAADLGRETVRKALVGLVEKSVIQLTPSNRTSRYTMLQPLRVFGRERARRAGTEDSTSARHLRWCRNLVPPEAWLSGTTQLTTTQTVEREYANITAALDFTLDHQDHIRAGVELFASVFFYIGLRGWYDDQRAYAEAFLTSEKARQSPQGAVVAFAAGMVAWYVYDLERARPRFQECADLGNGDIRAEGLALFGIGLCDLQAEDYKASAANLDRAMPLLEASQAKTTLVNARYQRSRIFVFENDYDAARTTIELNLPLTASGDLLGSGLTHLQLGQIAWGEQRHEQAEDHLKQAILHQSTIGHLFGLAASVDGLAWVAASNREHTRAAQLLGAAGRLYRELGTTLIAGMIEHRDQATARSRAALGEARFNTSREFGRRMTLDETIALALRESDGHPDPNTELTKREFQVAELVSRGATNGQISFELMVSTETVKSHIRTILKKLGYESRVQIAGWYAGHTPG